MTPTEMLREAADLSDDDVDRMAAALGWPSVAEARAGWSFSTSTYNQPARFWCEPEDRQRFEPFSVWLAGPMYVTSAGRCMVALRLLAEGAVDDHGEE
jgi:hypothetical protein